MYYSHYGLNSAPFPITPSRDLIYMSDAHREAYATLEWALYDANGFALVVGEPGTGKSSLISALLQPERDDIRIICRRQPQAFPALLHSVATELGIGAADDASLSQMARLIKAKVTSSSSRLVLIFDEAQALDDSTLEQLRLFADETLETARPIQLIFVAHPELRARLKQPVLRALDQRIVTRAELHPLQRSEMQEYVDHRLRLCGATADRLFTAPALRSVVRQSAGVPRLINLICHNALILAYAAGASRVSYRKVRSAAHEYKAQAIAPRRFSARGWLVSKWASLRALPQQFGPRPVVVTAILGVLLLPSGLQNDQHERLYGRYAAAARQSSSDLADLVLAPADPAPIVAPGLDATGNQPRRSVVNGPLQSHIVVAPDAEALPTQLADDALAVSSAAAAPLAGRADTTSGTTRAVVVHEGDTLHTVARDNLGSDEPAVIQELLKANPQLANADLIHPGEVLQVPLTK